MQWKRKLKAAGFKARGTGGRRGALMARNRGERTQTVGIMEHRHRPGHWNVELNIVAPMPYAEPPFEAVILEGDLGPTEIVTGHPQYSSWWGDDESPQAWQRMEAEGLSWLEEFSGTERLIEFYEAALRDGLPPAPEGERSSGFLGRMLGRASASNLPAPPHFHQWLVPLYAEVGKREDACRHALAFHAIFSGRRTKEEQERMARQLASLGCTGEVD